MTQEKLKKMLEIGDIFNQKTGCYIWSWNEECSEVGITTITEEEVEDFFADKTVDTSEPNAFYEYAIGGRARGYVVPIQEIALNMDCWDVTASIDNLRKWVNKPRLTIDRLGIIVYNLLTEICTKVWEGSNEEYINWLTNEIGLTQEEIEVLKENNYFMFPNEE